MNTHPPQRTSKGIVFGLSCADLKHEWILTVCLIMAITAVLSPLLLMFGLKFGIIDTALGFMMTDPRYREIRPLASRTFEPEWFDRMKQRPDVDFIIPMTRSISATIDASLKGKEKREKLSIIPTEAEDPLILENGSLIPGPGECVLTQLAAESLEAKPGDVIIARASRIRGSGFEYGSMDLKVAGILNIRASGLKSIYVQLNILEAVERFKDGQAVPEYGWDGSTPKAYPLYDGLVIVMPEKLSKVKELGLCNRTGFVKIETLTPEALYEKAGYRVSEDMIIYHLYTLKTPAGEESISEVRRRLRGKNARLFPWIAPIQAELINSSGKITSPLTLQVLSADRADVEKTALCPAPEWIGADEESTLTTIMLPPVISADEGPYTLRIEKKGEYLEFPVSIATPRSESNTIALIPDTLGGILRLHQKRNIRYHKKEGEFILFRQGYAAFRLYTNTIFDVDALRKFFEKDSLLVNTELLAINKVINLNKGMGLIFILLATVGITGCAASLTASLYASVERKKRELSVLRLIGLSGFNLFRFPVYQGIMIGAGGFLSSLFLFYAFAALINQWFRPYVEKLIGFALAEGVSFCRLPLPHLSGAFIATLSLAALAAVIAAFRITRIEPAEALRDE